MQIRRLQRIVEVTEYNSGWLPDGAAPPLERPVRRFRLWIEADDAGVFLICEEQRTGRVFDTWHQDLALALEQAHVQYGIEPSEWDEPPFSTRSDG